MPSWVTHRYICETCGLDDYELVDRSQVPDELPCKQEGCDATMRRAISAPAIRDSSRDALPSGLKNSPEAAFKLKEANKVRREMHKLPPQKRAEHQKEIRKLTKVDK